MPPDGKILYFFAVEDIFLAKARSGFRPCSASARAISRWIRAISARTCARTNWCRARAAAL